MHPVYLHFVPSAENNTDPSPQIHLAFQKIGLQRYAKRFSEDRATL